MSVSVELMSGIDVTLKLAESSDMYRLVRYTSGRDSHLQLSKKLKIAKKCLQGKLD